VSNAARFRHRPEFIDDAIATIRASVDRMRRVLEQLQGSSPRRAVGSGRADASEVLMEVRSYCADRHPIPEIDIAPRAVWVNMDRDQLASVLTHLVRNAQEATPADGQIRIGLSNVDTDLVITVADTGCGMDAAFLRDRLFRPFDSTKGVHGMGIGAYQAREIVRAAGGDVEVRSTPGVGTTFRLRVPLSERLGEGLHVREPAA
jgi:signal transduction histidine kinase